MSAQEISQEELEKRMEMMKQNCVFCKIIKKEIPSKIVFEDEICIAFLDINPATQGHLILIPKEHYMMLPMVPENVLGHMGVISRNLSDLLKQTFECKDVSIVIASGAAAGQQVQHFFMHVIPRYDDDGIDLDLSGEKLDEKELEDLAQKIKTRLTGN